MHPIRFRTRILFLVLPALPMVPHGAGAQAEPPAWRAQADARITEIRQREARVHVVDANGRPVEGATVEVRQTAKSFPFGAAISSQVLRNEQYREFFLARFNWAAFENEMKWYSNERRQGQEDYATADAMLAWCRENNIPVRGHTVFWAPEKWQPQWLRDMEDPDLLRAAVEKRATSVVGRYRGQLAHWDVNNEMLHGSFFHDRLGEDIRPWMFKRTHEIDPDAKLFVNEFNILSVDQNFDDVETDEYVRHTRQLIDQGTPIHGVGVQGHVWFEDTLAQPEKLHERLDKLATLGLPIWITEFDSAFDTEEANADCLELVYRMAYSHPDVEGIVMWVFWAGNSWRGPNAGLAHRDWSLNAAGQRYDALMAEWSTSASGSTDAAGAFAFQGFHGEYTATIHTPDSDEPAQTTFSLPPGREPLVIPFNMPE